MMQNSTILNEEGSGVSNGDVDDVLLSDHILGGTVMVSETN